jgi:uncharacterized protein (TIGR03435 family)
MKRNEKNLDEVLGRHLGLFKASPQSEALREGSLSRLQSRAADAVADEFSMNGARPRPRWPYFLAAAAVLVLGVLGFIRKDEAPAVVESPDGSLSRLSAETAQDMRLGERIETGQILRANKSGATVALADGTRVEMRAQSEFWIEQVADGIRIHLKRGDLRIKAAKQLAGHLYVQTKEMIVSVVGTVFLVNAEEEGSRVAVIEGEVRVQLGAATKNLLPGEQISTNPRLSPLSVKEEAGWIRTIETPVASVQQAAAPATLPGKMEFEAATIRPSTAQEPFWVGCRGIDGIIPNSRPSDVTIALGRCEGTTSLSQLVNLLYPHPLRRMEGMIQGGCCFELKALAEDPARTTKAQLRQMLEDFVVAQFKLKVHTEIRDRLGYTLTVTSGGPKIQSTQRAEDYRFIMENNPAKCCVYNGKLSLDEFAQVLPALTGNGPVENKTGLPGIYEIRLTVNRVVKPAPVGDPAPRGGGGNQLREPHEYDPPLAKAIEDQLGLRLEFGKQVPFEFLIVDSWERPPEN